MAARTFEDIMKFNPYHDARGRFAAANSYTSFTYAPGKSKAHDLAIQREKDRVAAESSKPKQPYINGLELDKILHEAHTTEYNNLSREEQNAIKRYMSSTGISDSYKNKHLVDEAIMRSELPVNATLTRGVKDLPTTMEEAKSMIGQSIGTTIKGKPVSTSINPTQNWGTSTIVIRADKGTKGMYVEVARQSKKAERARAKAAAEGKLSGESEFLLPSTTMLKITGVRMGSFKGQDKIIYDAVIDNQVGKSAPIAKTFDEVLKFNPYHDASGRFASASSYASFTYAPGKSKAHDLAIAREKERQAAAGGTNTATREHLPYMAGREAVEYTMKECGVSEQEAKEMVKEVSGYATGYAYDMRHWQQTGEGTSELTADEAKTMSDNVEKFIEKSPKWGGGELYRGIGVDKETAIAIEQHALSDKPIDMLGTSSWTSSKDVTEEFLGTASNYAIVYKTSGTKKGTSIDHLSEFSQDEVLISKDARWRCKEIYGDVEDMYLEITLEELP